MNLDRETIGRLLVHARTRTGLSRDEVAERSALSVRTLENYEQGRTIPRLDHAAAIAAACGVGLDSLVGLDGSVREEELPPAALRGRPRRAV